MKPINVFIVVTALLFFSCNSKTNNDLEEKHPLSLSDSLKQKFQITDSIDVIEFINYPDSLELAVFIDYNNTSKYFQSVEAHKVGPLDFNFYNEIGVSLITSGYRLPTKFAGLKGWYKNVGRKNNQTMYASTCDYETEFEINDTSILFPGMEETAFYEIKNVRLENNIVYFFTEYKLDSSEVIFKLYKSEFEHTILLEEESTQDRQVYLAAKVTDLKFFPMIVYICSDITEEFVYDKINLDSVKVDIGNNQSRFEYLENARKCIVICEKREQLEAPFAQAKTIKIFSFKDDSLAFKGKQFKHEIFRDNVLQKKNIQDEITLTTDQVEELNALFCDLKMVCPRDNKSNDVQPELMQEPDCVYFPHHIIVSYNYLGEVQGFMEVCFMCDMWNTSVGPFAINSCELQSKLQDFGIKYGLFPYPCE